MSPEVKALAEKLRQLNSWIIENRLAIEQRETMTFRQFYDQMGAKKRELGIDEAEVQRLRDDKVIDWELIEIAMTLDNRELSAQHHHFDLPLNVYFMDKYKAMLAEEDAYIAQQPPLVPIDMAPLYDIVEKHTGIRTPRDDG